MPIEWIDVNGMLESKNVFQGQATKAMPVDLTENSVQETK